MCYMLYVTYQHNIDDITIWNYYKKSQCPPLLKLVNTGQPTLYNFILLFFFHCIQLHTHGHLDTPGPRAHANTHAREHTRTHTHTHMYTVTHSHMHTVTHTLTHTHTGTHTLSLTHTHTHTHTHARTHARTHTHTHTHTHTRLCCSQLVRVE